MSGVEQQEEFISILDEHKKTNLNAIIMQIRPACDAFYPSPYEPWSEYLTGTQGKPPSDPYYDPLEFMIDETHKRGMEFHAWFNPYRAVHDTKTSSIAPTSVVNLHPEWVVKYANYQMLDPGLQEVRDYIASVIEDIVTRYDIDGIHSDDFYAYPYIQDGEDFNDTATFDAYPRGFTNKADWRRDNINLSVQQVSKTIKDIKPKVKFGISPFGIYKNDTPSGIIGMDAYDEIYCDSISWLKNKYLDYLAPELYWQNGGPQDFTKLQKWWGEQRIVGENHIYVGLAAYRLDPSVSDWDVNDITTEIEIYRNNSKDIFGSIFFSSKSLTNNLKGIQDTLREQYFTTEVPIPKMPWLQD